MILNHLPNYTGPFKVACRDVEYIKGRYPTFKGNTAETENKFATEKDVSPLVVKIFYPADSDKLNKLDRNLANWASYPSNQYIKGLMDYKGINHYLASALSRVVNVPKLAAYHGNGNEIISSPSNLPVTIFSHGLAGARTGYSALCGELASYGMIVCSIEHQEGSAAFTYNNYHNKSIDYIQAPGKEPEAVNKEFRSKQIDYRVQEVERAVELLKDLNEGNVSLEDCVQPSSWDPDFYKLKDSKDFHQGLSSFKNRMNWQELYIVGHSFGGATTLKVLNDSSNPFKAGVVLDPWMYPIPDLHITRPLFINFTQGFREWSVNFDRVVNFKSSLSEAERQLWTIAHLPNSVHIHQSDIPTVLGKFAGRMLPSSEAPEILIQRFALSSLSYLKRFMKDKLPGSLELEHDLLNEKSDNFKSFVHYMF